MALESGNKDATSKTLNRLAAIAKQAIERIGWPTLGKRSSFVSSATTYYQEPVATATYDHRSEGDSDSEQQATVNLSNQPSI